MVKLETYTWFRLYYVCLGVIVIAGLLVHFLEHGEEPEFWWLGIPLFTAFFAFLGGLVLLAFSKLGVFPVIKRGEDYYEKH
jgi:hypothetical protein